MRILIIEDDREQCTLLQFRLEKEGFAVDVCNDGADADFDELMAHIRCRLRRTSGIENNSSIDWGDLSYEPGENTLSGPDGNCSLSNKEGELLDLFLRNPEHTLQRQTILARIWGADYEIEDGNLDNYIYFIRRRLKKVGSSAAIKTVRGIGYRLVAEEE